MGDTDLEPDVVAAIKGLSGTGLGKRYNRYARTNFGVSGRTLAARQIAGESGGRANAVSSAGARGRAQFMPATRAEFVKKYGIDPWGSAQDAVKALEMYDLQRGVAGYNPGMPGYTNYVLGQRLSPGTQAALHGGAQSGGMVPGQPPSTDVRLKTDTIPGVDNAAKRDQARADFLLNGNFSLGALLKYKEGLNSLKDVPAETHASGLQVTRSPGSPTKYGDSAASGKGEFSTTGANPGRLQPAIVKFAREVSAVYGRPLSGDSGATHSKYTVNGNVSDHFSGHATDIPATGHALIRMGQAALIAAGMPRAKALRQTGGLFNVNGHQVIFNTHEGGDHTNHLHISAY